MKKMAVKFKNVIKCNYVLTKKKYMYRKISKFLLKQGFLS